MTTSALASLEHPTLSGKSYEKQLGELQLVLSRLQVGLYRTHRRAIIAIEGIDAAGKGSAIRRMTWQMDPRGVRVYPIGEPTADELKEHFLQRFRRRIPKPGEIAVFDRTWYGRVLIERVENLAPEEDWQNAYGEINEFEQSLIDNGHILIKLFFAITREEQSKRLRARFEDPAKQWKLSEADLISHAHWDGYQLAYRDMLDRTSAGDTPWHVIAANDKKYARITAMERVREVLAHEIDLDAIEPMSPEFAAKVRDALY